MNEGVETGKILAQRRSELLTVIHLLKKEVDYLGSTGTSLLAAQVAHGNDKQLELAGQLKISG